MHILFFGVAFSVILSCKYAQQETLPYYIVTILLLLVAIIKAFFSQGHIDEVISARNFFAGHNSAFRLKLYEGNYPTTEVVQ